MPPPQVIIIIIMKVMFNKMVVFKMKFQGVFQLVEVSPRLRSAPQQIDADDFLKSLPSGQRLQVFCLLRNRDGGYHLVLLLGIA